MTYVRPCRTIRAFRRAPMYFVAICRDRADGLETRLANRPPHLEFLKAQSKRIKVGGPFLTPDGERMIGSVLILEAGDEAEARAILAEDPYGEAGLAALPGSLRHPVSGRDPQEGDDDDRDSSFGHGWFGPGWAHVAPAQA